MKKDDQKLYIGELVVLSHCILYDYYKKSNLWQVYNPKRNRYTLAYEYELLPVPHNT